KFDAEATDFNLMIDAAQIFDCAVGEKAGAIAGAIKPMVSMNGGQTNRLTPYPGPLPFEGRGRIGSLVQGFQARNRTLDKALAGEVNRLNRVRNAVDAQKLGDG